MIRNFLPQVMDKTEVETIDSLINALSYLKGEAEREGQDFIAYAIEDAILQANGVRGSKFYRNAPHNMQ